MVDVTDLKSVVRKGVRVQVPPLVPLRKLVKNMGKRPYYIIHYIRDYDGYETFLEYVGSNYKAALNRYIKLFEYLKKRDFIDEGVAEENISAELRLPTEDHPLRPGGNLWSYLNDNDSFYESICISCCYTNSYSNSFFEEKYKTEFPDSKY